MVDYKKDKTNEKDILIQAVSDIRAICGQEFRGGYTNKILSGNNILESYVPDTRRQYCQLVDFLSDFLLSKFDTPTKEMYEQTTKNFDELITKKNDGEITAEEFISTKLRLSRSFLQHLFILLDKNNWFRKATTTG